MIVDKAEVPVYLKIAEKATHLRALGMSDKAISRALGVSDKTVAKAIALLSPRPAGHMVPDRVRAPRCPNQDVEC